jgi:hypothetical protein
MSVEQTRSARAHPPLQSINPWGGGRPTAAETGSLALRQTDIMPGITDVSRGFDESGSIGPNPTWSGHPPQTTTLTLWRPAGASSGGNTQLPLDGADKGRQVRRRP